MRNNNTGWGKDLHAHNITPAPIFIPGKKGKNLGKMPGLYQMRRPYKRSGRTTFSGMRSYFRRRRRWMTVATKMPRRWAKGTARMPAGA